jgi:hypothetical protein
MTGCRMVIAKASALAVVFYLGYLAVNCPCGRLWACHQDKIWVAIGLLIGIMLIENGVPSFLKGGKRGGSACARS